MLLLPFLGVASGLLRIVLYAVVIAAVLYFGGVL